MCRVVIWVIQEVWVGELAYWLIGSGDGCL